MKIARLEVRQFFGITQQFSAQAHKLVVCEVGGNAGARLQIWEEFRPKSIQHHGYSGSRKIRSPEGLCRK